MPRSGSYVDNAANRRLGRVGMSYGTAVQSSGGSYGFSMPSSSYSSCGTGSFGFSSKTYVDNPMNRRLDRVGMEHGTAVHSSSSNSPLSSRKTYVDNSHNRSLGRVGMEHGTAVEHKSPSSSSSACRPSSTTYVDNPHNRSLGRVGMEKGTAVEHKSPSSSSSARRPSSNTYVDNPHNRSLGRVGMEKGTAVEHKSSAGTSPLRYVDSPQNRKLDRVGMPRGSLPASGTFSGSEKCYVDNRYNRKLGRVGLPLGSKAVVKGAGSTTAEYRSPTPHLDGKVYVDNAFNRRHNRVGLPLGSKPVSRKHEVYRDTEKNRALNRVGKPWGTCKESMAYKLDQLQEWVAEEPDESVHVPDFLPETIQALFKNQEDLNSHLNQVLNHMRRERQHDEWMASTAVDSCLGDGYRTSETFMETHKGMTIQLSDLEIYDKIGEGGFGEVFWAYWGEEREVVAVKKIKGNGLTQKRRRRFLKEAEICCDLQHANIVRFIGVCEDDFSLAIVMEYVDTSLFEALHMDKVEFYQDEQLAIMRDVCEGMRYLHYEGIAHCDLKTQNILLNNVPGSKGHDNTAPVIAKITDFGLSKLKSDMSMSQSNMGKACFVGTYRYAAPEILRGELLMSIDEFKKGDIYSMGMLIWELVTQEIPFEDLSVLQLTEHVGRRGLTPNTTDYLPLSVDLNRLLSSCLSFDPNERPLCDKLAETVESLTSIYAEEE